MSVPQALLASIFREGSQFPRRGLSGVGATYFSDSLEGGTREVLQTSPTVSDKPLSYPSMLSCESLPIGRLLDV